ncbi:MAG: hypothetical protein L6R40_000988 [Gallowayella cf. fulva]|nr:MAG: hypothetical protein L6R40_000988 [Xanthomendoza cf. fulva]
MKRKREVEEGGRPSRPRPAQHSLDCDQALETKKMTVDAVEGINSAIGKMDSCLLADYIAQRTKKFGGDLSLVELGDMHIPESAILDTSDWNQDRLARALPSFLTHIARQNGRSTNLSVAPTTEGSPHTIVLTGAALRAAELSRVLREFQGKEATVAKLFAKHIKLKDAVEFVQKTRINIGVGTPSRIIDLLTERALNFDHLERVIIDCSFLDQKKRNIFDMRETQQPLMHLLNRPELRSHYTSIESPVRLAFY